MTRATDISGYKRPSRRGGALTAAAFLGALLWGGLAPRVGAQVSPFPPQAPAKAPDQAPAAQPQPAQDDLGLGADWSVHAQLTIIEQYNPSFPSAYDGPNSFGPGSEAEHTLSFSLYLARKLWEGAELFYNPEIFQGYGLSRTFGIAGFPNGEAVKSGFANLHYNTSRLFLRQTFGFGGGKESVEDDANQFAGQEDVNRLTLSVGKFAASDFFDDNAYSHDSRTQFMNWALWESAAWDVPSDIVGFIGGAVAEWNTPNTTWRYGLLMETHESNGLRLDHRLDKAHGQILQYDYRYVWSGHHGTIRTFVFWNQANMGSYALTSYQAYPEDITLTRSYRSKVGFGSSWDQELTADLGAFVRLSWDDGRTESFSFTEIDRSLAGGLSLKGNSWGRSSDTAGLALVVNGLAPDHQRYLENGGTGLVLGDGALSYSSEEIVEAYYAFKPWPWLQLGPDCQYIRNPGYNSVRGPVPVFAFRGHVEF